MRLPPSAAGRGANELMMRDGLSSVLVNVEVKLNAKYNGIQVSNVYNTAFNQRLNGGINYRPLKPL